MSKTKEGLGLYQKLLVAQRNAPKLENDGFNVYTKTSCPSSHQVITKVAKALNDAGLVGVVNITQLEPIVKGAARILATLKVIDPDTGDELEIVQPGYSEDGKSDKAIYQAASITKKYLYMQVMGMSNYEDPEAGGYSPAPEVYTPNIIKKATAVAATATAVKQKQTQAQQANAAFGGQGQVLPAAVDNVLSFSVFGEPHTIEKLITRLGKSAEFLQEELGPAGAQEFIMKKTGISWLEPDVTHPLHSTNGVTLARALENLLDAFKDKGGPQ